MLVFYLHISNKQWIKFLFFLTLVYISWDFTETKHLPILNSGIFIVHYSLYVIIKICVCGIVLLSHKACFILSETRILSSCNFKPWFLVEIICFNGWIIINKVYVLFQLEIWILTIDALSFLGGLLILIIIQILGITSRTLL